MFLVFHYLLSSPYVLSVQGIQWILEGCLTTSWKIKNDLNAVLNPESVWETLNNSSSSSYNIWPSNLLTSVLVAMQRPVNRWYTMHLMESFMTVVITLVRCIGLSFYCMLLNDSDILLYSLNGLFFCPSKQEWSWRATIQHVL